MPAFRLPLPLIFAALLSCTACTVYTPMQPHAPLIRAQGQAEIGLHMQASLRPELQAAYSPFPHVIMLAAGTWRPSLPLASDGKGNTNQQDRFRTAQYEAGMGMYCPLGPNWVATAVVGTGEAQCQRRTEQLGLLFGNVSGDYNARYRKGYAQLGFAYQSGRDAVGFGYRLTQVKFTELTVTETSSPYNQYALPLSEMLRHEPYFFAQYSLDGPMSQSRWQLQMSGAFSFSEPEKSSNSSGASPLPLWEDRNRGGSVLASLGIVFCPRKTVVTPPTR